MNKYKYELKNICLGYNVSFNNKINQIFVLLSTLGLQFISFFTTFSGTHYYFGNITTPKFLGPLIITSVIQFSLFYLSNSIVNREHVNSGKKIMLSFFLVVSILFSYTGMIHTIITPHKQMKANYEEFVDKYEDIYQVYMSNFNHNETVASYIENKVNELNILLDNKISTTKIQLDNTKKYSSTSSSSNTTTNLEGNTSTSHSSSSTINTEWTKLNNEYNMLVNLKKRLSNSYKSILNGLSNALNYESENEIIEALKGLDISFITTFNYIVDTIKELNKIKNYEMIYYQLKNNQDIINNKILTYEEIENSINMNKDNSNIEYLNKISNIIEEEILNYEKSIFYTEDLTHLGIDKNTLNELKESSIQAKTIKDFNSLAFNYLNPTNSTFSKAIITFIFACFIDLTTFLIPFFMNRKTKNILFIKSKKDISNIEESLFDQYLYTIELTKNNIDNSNKLKLEIEEFIKIFELSSSTIKQGYSFRCSKDTFEEYLKNKPNMIGFIIYLMNMDYLYMDEKHIYDEQTYLYIRNKFMIYFKQIHHHLSQYIMERE